jgi:hypothetical protein
MSNATATLAAPVKVRPRSVVAGWTSGARTGAAITLIASGLLWFIADVIDFNGDEMTFMSAHPTLAGIGVSSDMLAIPFLLGSVAVWLLLARKASTKLAWIGSILLVCGLVGQGIIEGVEMIGYTVAQTHAMTGPAYTDLTNNLAGLPGKVFALMFFVGAGLGIVLTMIAVWRSRAVPRTAAALLIAFQVIQTVGVPFPATAVALAGFVLMAIAILRTPHATSSAPVE